MEGRGNYRTEFTLHSLVSIVTGPKSAERKSEGTHLFFFFTFFHGSIRGIEKFSGCLAISCRPLTCFLRKLACDDQVSDTFDAQHLTTKHELK